MASKRQKHYYATVSEIEEIDNLLSTPPEYIPIVSNKNEASCKSSNNTNNKPVHYNYYYIPAHNTYHDSACPRLKNLEPDECYGIDIINKEYQICPKCGHRILLRKGLTNPSGAEINKAEDILKKLNASVKYMQILVDENNAKLSLTISGLKVVVNEDAWIFMIDSKTGKKKLLHNNYSIKYLERVSEQGYHEQKVSQKRFFSDAVDIIVGYSWDEHVDTMFGQTKKLKREEKIQKLREAKEMDNALKNAPVNYLGGEISDILQPPGMFRIKKFHLLYDKYILIDSTKSILVNQLKAKGVNVKIVSKSTAHDSDMVLIKCNIPKWHRKYIASVIPKVKRKLIKELGEDYYYARRALRYLLEKKKIDCSMFI